MTHSQTDILRYEHSLTTYALLLPHPVQANIMQTFLHSQLTSEYRCTDYCLKSGAITAVDGETPSVLSAVIVHGMTVAKAVASSGRYAKVKASSRALAALEGMSRTEFRKRFNCDCQGDHIPVAEFGTAI